MSNKNDQFQVAETRGKEGDDKPLISVLMSAYNAQKFIAKAVQSILNQTYTNFEFIIINDGSDDKTAEIIQSFSDKRIVFIDKPKNAGIIITVNAGIELAQGEYIARMDADDESLPERLRLQIEFMQKHKNIGVLGAAKISIDNNKSLVLRLPKSHKKCLFTLTEGNCIWQPVAMIRKSALKNIRYNPKYIAAEDYKLWVDLAKNGVQFANLQEPLLKYNLHDKNIGKTHFDIQQKNAKLIQQEWIKFYYNIDNGKTLDFLLSG